MGKGTYAARGTAGVQGKFYETIGGKSVGMIEVEKCQLPTDHKANPSRDSRRGIKIVLSPVKAGRKVPQKIFEHQDG